MSIPPPDKPEADIAAPAVNKEGDTKPIHAEAESGNLEARSSSTQAPSGPRTNSATRNSGSGDNKESMGPESRSQRIVDGLEEENWEAFDPFSDPKFIADLARFSDDPIPKLDGFMAAAILPGENLKQFEDLLAEVFQELQLEGGLERQLGLLITHYLWRLNNLEIFHFAQRARAKYGKHFKNGPDAALFGILSHMFADFLREFQIGKLRDEASKGISECLNKMGKILIKDPSLSYLSKALPLPPDLQLSPEQMAAFSGSARCERLLVDADLAAFGELITPERFSAELELRERLCAAIGVCLKLIVQLKGMKKKLVLGSAQTPRPQIVIKSGGPPDWGRVRLVTTKRRK